MTIKALVLDDEPSWHELITEILKEEGYAVYVAETLAHARELLLSQLFHLAVVDVILKGQASGLDLLEDIALLNQNSGVFCAPVVLTGYPTRERAELALRKGAFDFLQKSEEPVVLKRGNEGKGFVENELRKVSRRVLREVLIRRSERYEDNKYTLHMKLTPGRKTEISLSGPAPFSTESEKVLEMDIDGYAQRADDLQLHFDLCDSSQRKKWRTRAKAMGRDLYQTVVASDAEIMRSWTTATERSNGRFHVCFSGSQDLIRLPLELMLGETGHLSAERPLTRQIAGVSTVRERGIDRVFLGNASEVKILLIGSNTYPPIPGVDDEINLLSELLPRLFSSRGIKCTVQMVPTEESYYDNVYNILDHCTYHIVHYAGHGFHDEVDVDDSGIVFWEKPGKATTRPMPIRVLRNLLKGSSVRFVYLSCCQGAATASDANTRLTGNDFQGILEGIVRIGIPGALGFRWNLQDSDAKMIAQAFYENLLTDLRLDSALYKARVKLQEDKYYSETWASPVLVTQSA